MILSAGLRPALGANSLLEDFRTTMTGRIGSDLVRLLRDWGLEATVCAEVPGAIHVVHPVFHDLQMDVPRLEYIHSYTVEEAVGLIDQLRVKLAGVTFEDTEEGL
jgi:hypothetical protein